MSVKGSDLYISECCIYDSKCIRILVKLFRELNIVMNYFLLHPHFLGKDVSILISKFYILLTVYLDIFI